MDNRTRIVKLGATALVDRRRDIHNTPVILEVLPLIGGLLGARF